MVQAMIRTDVMITQELADGLKTKDATDSRFGRSWGNCVHHVGADPVRPEGLDQPVDRVGVSRAEWTLEIK